MEILNKKRQYLPLMSVLDMSVDIDRLRKEFFEFGYDDWSLYNGLKADYASENGRIVREILLGYFLNDEEKAEREGQLAPDGGEAYKMLCLTDFNAEKAGSSLDAERIIERHPELIGQAAVLEKIQRKDHPLYIPEADESNYDKPSDYLKGYVKDVRDMFKGYVTRTRYAVLMPGESIKPHRDLNTDRAIRLHVPLLTNEGVTIGVKGKKSTIEMHWPADGSVYFLNAGYEHWVKNESDEPRVHLVMSVVGQQDIQHNRREWWDGDEV